MKILFIVMRFPPNWLSGTELSTYNISKYMGKKHDVSVVTSHEDGMPLQSSIDGFEVYRIPISEIRFLGLMIFWFKMFLTIKKIKPDIIQIQGITMTVPAVLAKKVLGIPYVISGRGCDVYKSWPFKETISKLGFKNTDTSVALTGDMKKAMQKFSNKRIEVVPNGIDTKKFNFDKYESREKLGLDHDKKIVLFVGRLEPVKGLKYLIEAISILKDTKNLELIVVGNGNEKHKLERLAEDLKLNENVTFAGKISNKKIPEYMAAADMFVLPSLSEGFPVVLLEAMAAGLPIVTTKVKGLPEIIEDNVNGLLVLPKNPEELADKINLLLNDENLTKKISILNKEKSKSYSWENVALTLEKVYVSTINDSK